MEHITRRQILTPLGLAAGSCVLSSCLSRDMTTSPGKDRKAGFPWAYVELDPDITAERAYNYCNKGCMYGVFASVVIQMSEKRGEPYKSFPLDMMRYGAGGAGGSGSLCGALNGAAALMGLFAGTGERLNQGISELFLWYEQTELPVYHPRKPSLDIVVPTSVSNSVLCHASVSRWCEASGFEASGSQRKERCRRLTADTARKTVEILNAVLTGHYQAVAELSEDVKTCMACHTKGSELSNTRGTMYCSSCHFSLAKDHPTLTPGS